MNLIVRDENLSEPEYKVSLQAMQTGENYIFAHTSGFFEHRVNVGDDVQDGQIVGYIWNT